MSLPFDTLRSGTPGCPSDLALDRLVARELDATATTQLEAHVAGCASCQARLTTLRQGWAAHPAVDERKLLAHIRQAAAAEPTPWWRRLQLPALGAVLATGVMVVALWRAPPTTDDGLRAKGGLLLRVYRATAEGNAEALESGATLRGGDRLRFVADFPANGMAAIVGVEASGALYVAWPTEQSAAAVKKGVGVELPGAVALDDSSGDETLFLVHCPGRAEPFTCTSTGPGQAPACGTGCSSVAFAMRKP